MKRKTVIITFSLSVVIIVEVLLLSFLFNLLKEKIEPKLHPSSVTVIQNEPIETDTQDKLKTEPDISIEEKLGDIELFYEVVNDYRAERKGLKRLTTDEGLEKFAKDYASLCMEKGEIQHNMLDTDTIREWLNKYSKIEYTYINEILQSGTIEYFDSYQGVLNNFLNSPPHKEAIELRGVKTIGAAYVYNEEGGIYFAAYIGVVNTEN